MSSSFEIDNGEDPELLALRNELLNSLSKRNSKKSSNNSTNEFHIESNLGQNVFNEANFCNENNSNTEITQTNESESNVEEDDELERLRSEALNARRAKNSNIFLNKEELKKNNKPGRFRYDKESEEDDEDEDEFDSYLNNNDEKKEDEEEIDEENDSNEEEYQDFSNETDKTNSNGIKQNSVCNFDEPNKNLNFYLQSDPYESSNNNNLEYVPSSNFDTYKKNYNNNFHNNYKTYRFEFSKLMSNDAYEPPNTPTNCDLRKYLQAKTSKLPELTEKYSPKMLSRNDDGQLIDDRNLDDLVDYALPITQPINISDEIFNNNKRNSYTKFRGKYLNDYNNNTNNKRNYFNRNLNHLDIDERHTSPGKKHENYKSQDDKEISFEPNKEDEENNRCNNENECNVENDDDNDNDDDDEDDEDDLSYKKLRSVVAKAIISNDKPTQSYRDSLNSRNYSSRYSPSPSSYNFYRRNHSSSTSSK